MSRKPYEKVIYAVHENAENGKCYFSGQAKTKTEAIWAIIKFMKKQDIEEYDNQVIFSFDVE